MEISSQVYSSRKNQLLRYENFKAASSSEKNTAHDDSEGSAAADQKKKLVNCCWRSKNRSHSRKGKGIPQANNNNIGVEEMNHRMKKIEQENEAMKQAFIEIMEERKKLVNEIYKDFHKLRNCHRRLGNQVTGLKFWDESHRGVNPSDEAAVGNGLSQILCEDSNPCVVIRDQRAKFFLKQL